jgi:hypothetical protein
MGNKIFITNVQSFVEHALYVCNETNLIHCWSSVYSVTIPLHVSGLLVAYHQEVIMYICNNWYVLYYLVDCQLAWPTDSQLFLTLTFYLRYGAVCTHTSQVSVNVFLRHDLTHSTQNIYGFEVVTFRTVNTDTSRRVAISLFRYLLDYRFIFEDRDCRIVEEFREMKSWIKARKHLNNSYFHGRTFWRHSLYVITTRLSIDTQAVKDSSVDKLIVAQRHQ